MLAAFRNEQSELQWKMQVQLGNWQDAIAELENIEKNDPKKAPWVKKTTAWIQYSFIDRIAKDDSERALFLTSIYGQLQDEPILQGYLLFAHDAEKELGLKSNDPKASATKWLLALKRDQTNPDIFYSLGVYYYFRESNAAKALKCLEKALLLQPNFEQAFLLKYTILCNDGKADEAMESIGKI